MHNIKLTLQYDGAGFSGYELQPGKRTIRGGLEKALFKLFKKPLKIIAASRTDAGVHAVGNIISFNAPSQIATPRLARALNFFLPHDIRIVGAESGSEKFNARFDAKSKTYDYLIYNGAVMPPHLRRIAWQVKPKLNLTTMKKAAKYLIGKHDFSSFCAAGGDDSNFVRIIHQLVISHLSLVIWGKDKVIRMRITGNGFLYKMVRNIVGTLVAAGMGKSGYREMEKILEAGDRRLAGRTAPAQGLCLVRVKF
jgi:tRNA pseudouridine38-40 synthase